MTGAEGRTTSGLLIVNADDWGLDAATTEAIAACFLAGRITSATAMVFMADSERAAVRALELGLPLGLHLNLSEPYTGSAVPEAVRARQARLAPRFGDRQRRRRRWLPTPGLGAAIEACVVDQLAQFEALYGRPPTHVDGHKHVQVSPSVARTPALSGYMLRRAFSDQPGARSPMALARRLRHHAVLRRSAGTDRFVPIWSLREELLAGREPRGLPPRTHDVVEVMAHPGSDRELPLLQTDAWGRVMAAAPLGTYEDLR
jgi:predicted glycoside hydrolase/deacetylase ChbG (UPF0249 family)